MKNRRKTEFEIKELAFEPTSEIMKQLKTNQSNDVESRQKIPVSITLMDDLRKGRDKLNETFTNGMSQNRNGNDK